MTYFKIAFAEYQPTSALAGLAAGPAADRGALGAAGGVHRAAIAVIQSGLRAPLHGQIGESLAADRADLH